MLYVATQINVVHSNNSEKGIVNACRHIQNGSFPLVSGSCRKWSTLADQTITREVDFSHT